MTRSRGRRPIFWYGFSISTALLLCSFPSLWSDRIDGPSYMSHLAYTDELIRRVIPESQHRGFWDLRSGRWPFIGFSVLNPPVWLLNRQDTYYEWIRRGSTRDTYLADLADEKAHNCSYYFRVTWPSDGRFLIVAVTISAVWWSLISLFFNVWAARRPAA
jgi:hypothetical protein